MKLRLTTQVADKLLNLLGPSVTDPDIAELWYQIERRIARLAIREKKA